MLRSLRTRGKEKNTGIANPGVEVVASKLLPNYIEFMPGYLGAFTLKNSGSDFHSRLPFPSLPIHLRHKHIFTVSNNIFLCSKNQTLESLYTLLYQEDLGVNQTPGIERGHLSTPPSVLNKTEDSLGL